MPDYQEFIIPNHPELRLRVYGFNCKTWEQRYDAGYCAVLNGEAVPQSDLPKEQYDAFGSFLYDVFPE